MVTAVVSQTGLRCRPGTPADAEVCGRICYDAFTRIANAHNLPPDFPSPEVAIELTAMMLSRPEVYSVVAELNERIVGSTFLMESDPINSIGPISVDPEVQNSAIGRTLMENLIARAESRNVVGVRLVQAAYHNRSLALYTKLGFQTREPLTCLQGRMRKVAVPGRRVRVATIEDTPACDALHLRVHGVRRTGELTEAINAGEARVVIHDGRITGYTTGVGFFGFTLGETDDDLKALIGAAAGSFGGPGFLLPTRNTPVFRWCLERGLRVVQPMTLMSLGLYNEPAGAFIPSVMY